MHYVANRVALNRENTDLSQWRYVRSKDNPADEALRGMSAFKFMQQRRWIHAPEFLWKAEGNWAVEKSLVSQAMIQDNPEVRRGAAVFTTVTTNETPTDCLLSFFSDWMKLLKAVAWYVKIKNILMLIIKRQKELTSGHIAIRSSSQKMSTDLSTFKTTLGGQLLTVEDLSQAERSVITYVQRQSFPVEMAALETTPFRVKRDSKICRLDPVLDKGIIKSNLAQERLLPDLPPFTNLGLDYSGPLKVRRGRSMVMVTVWIPVYLHE